MKPQAIILDLDNCLASADEPGTELFAPAINAIRAANRGTLSEEMLNEALSACWRHPLDWVATKYGFSDAMLTAAWKVLTMTEVTEPMHGYGDLATLAELPARLFLVTSGFRRLQESKINALRLRPLFSAIYVDAIDEADRKGKQALFEQILATYQLRPGDVLVVGDSSDSEIAAGNRLGIRTVQTLRPGVPRAHNATYYVHALGELKQLLTSLADNEA